MKDSLKVGPSGPVAVALSVPGDKSISQRAAILAALAEGESSVKGFLESEDCLNTLRACEHMGAAVSRGRDEILIRGCGGRLQTPRHPLDLGNSGTGMRLLAGVVAGQEIEATLTGDASLMLRPMQRIAAPLAAMGADVRLTAGHAPIVIRGGGLHGIRYVLPVASAQVKSCVLFAGLYADGVTEVVEPMPCRDHTERMLTALGASISIRGDLIRLIGDPGRAHRFNGRAWQVPGDFSSAAYWMVAGAMIDGAQVRLCGIGLNPRRTALLDVLARMGAVVTTERVHDAGGERVGDVVVRGCPLRGTVVEGSEIPNLIDELPLIAAAGAVASGITVIRDAAELRVKESDRIAATASLLTACGVSVEAQSDGLIVKGGARIRSCEIDSGGDHRIAMTAAVLGLSSDGAVTIRGFGCVATSYPCFSTDLKLFSEHVE